MVRGSGRQPSPGYAYTLMEMGMLLSMGNLLKRHFLGRVGRKLSFRYFHWFLIPVTDSM
jgi:hypothetical protein